MFTDFPTEKGANEILLDKVYLCVATGIQAINGMCPTHKSDSCLAMFVRFDYFMQVAEEQSKEAMRKTRASV